MKRARAATVAILALGWLALPALAQKTRPPATPQPAAEPEGPEEEPPEEDESLKPPTEYTFNPLQAEKEMKIGAFYFKRGSYRAAMLRFEEATKWNPAMPEAWRRLGEAQEKLEDEPAALVAYRKFVEMAPAAKESGQVKKKIANLSKSEQARGDKAQDTKGIRR